jgi:hypothetical protein
MAAVQIRALKEAFYRNSLPNVLQLLSTVVIFMFVIYFQACGLLSCTHFGDRPCTISTHCWEVF